MHMITHMLAQEVAKGKWHFIVKRGMLGYGLLLALVCNAAMFAAVDEWNSQGVVASFVLFPVVGVFWGAFTWWWLNRCLRRMQAKDLNEGGA